MKMRQFALMFGIFVIGVLMFGFAEAATNTFQSLEPSFNTYYSSEQIATYWPRYSSIMNDQCEASSDFIVMIKPGSCSPTVVRSDLLAEQNVPVFCQLDALKINPLIKVSSIKAISFKGGGSGNSSGYPEGVAGISFHPARAAINTYKTLLGSPILNNIGYVVIILKQEPNEKLQPEEIFGNLTATIYYDADKAYGTGKAEFYAPVLSESEWGENYRGYNFWQGKGFLRVTDVDSDKAKIALYTDKDNIFSSFILEKGKTSNKIYFPGFYCRAGLKVKLNDVVAPEVQAKLNIDGQTFWVRKGSKFLNDRCSVKDIAVNSDRTGVIKIYCPGENFELRLRKNPASITVDGVEGNYYIGDKLKSEKLVVSLAYYGELPDKLKKVSVKDFVVLVTGIVSESDKIKIAGAVKTYFAKEGATLDKLADELIKLKTGFTDKTLFVYGTEDKATLEAVDKTKGGSADVKFLGISSNAENSVTLEGDERFYFEKSIEAVEKLVDLYPYEGSEINKYGENVLWSLIELAGYLKQSKTQKGLVLNFTKVYSNSEKMSLAVEKLRTLDFYDVSNVGKTVAVNNEDHYLSVEDFEPLDKSKKSVQITMGGFSGIFGVDEKFGFTGSKGVLKSLTEADSKESYIRVNEIGPGKVKLSYYQYTEGKDGKKGSFSSAQLLNITDEGAAVEVNGRIVKIVKITAEKVAYVSLIPEVDNTKTEADFSFRIGVEKRALDLSPEEARDRIKELNKTISDWEDRNEKLGNLVKGMKGACFATAGVLMVKNMISGFSGGSMARVKVMEGYRKKCDTAIKLGTEIDGKIVKSRTECYNLLADKINADVEAYSSAINRINDNIKANKVETGSSGSLETKTTTSGTESLKKYVNSLSEKGIKVAYTDSNKKEQTIDVSKAKTYEQAKSAELWWELNELYKDKKVTKDTVDIAKADMDSKWQPVISGLKSEEAVASATSDIKKALGGSSTAPKVQTPNSQKVELLGWNGQTLKEYPDMMKKLKLTKGDTKIQFFRYEGKDYLLILGQTMKTDKLGVEAAYVRSESDWKEVVDGTGKGTEKTLSALKKFEFFTGGKCENKFITPRVKYYASGVDEGMPAIVPFDLEKGWYAKVPSSGSGALSSTQQGYKSSGEVSYYYICNVGSYGKEDNGGGNDICQGFHINQNVEEFGGCSLTSAEIKKLSENAREAIRQAARQYGQKVVTIFKNKIQAEVTSSEPAYECQDFMSPEECKLMFNVCDPVICPTSRCDFGGAYKVSNVVQSGIIGSIVLCLPNFREGIIIPVCLTGIHAGIDNWISVLKAHQQCLQTQLDSGQVVGICDEVSAIYTCEFFWSQFAPLVKVLLPKIISSLYGAPAVGRGGGEYLTIMSSWENTQKAVDYFKNEYAQTTFRAFNLGSTEEIGSMFCKSFLGTSVPGGGSLLDSLLEPESPVQFYGQFSEIKFSDATVPSTSQYKVYYHVYAGNNAGAHFRVYLKDPPSTGYYQSASSVNVKTGYIPKGEMIDETLDFTAPSGYKQLCVQIDAQTWCGFKQVSTSALVEYVKDKYIADQANQTVTTEKACVSGTASLWSLANLNIQAGITETADSDITLRGIVRVCATQNPGTDDKGEGKARWVDVGYCGDEKLRCWLDSESVKAALKVIDAVEGTNTAQQLQNAAEIALNNDSVVLPEKDTQARLASLRTKIDELIAKLSKPLSEDGKAEIEKIASELDGLAGLDNNQKRGFLNVHRAEALSLKYNLYEGVVRVLLKGVAKSAGALVAGVSGGEVECNEAADCYGSDEDFNYVYECVDNMCVLQEGGSASPEATEESCKEEGSCCDISISIEQRESEKKLVCAFVQVDEWWVELDSESSKELLNNPQILRMTFSNALTEKPAVTVSIGQDTFYKDGDAILRTSDGRWILDFDISEYQLPKGQIKIFVTGDIGKTYLFDFEVVS